MTQPKRAWNESRGTNTKLEETRETALKANKKGKQRERKGKGKAWKTASDFRQMWMQEQDNFGRNKLDVLCKNQCLILKVCMPRIGITAKAKDIFESSTNV